MGASLLWYPKHKKEFQIKSNYTSSTIEKITNSFGTELTEKDITKLDNFYEATGENIYKELAELVSKNGTILLKKAY